ncbi:DNA cytosine methyltransferase [Prauserella cavernicola]|uniref:DNA cytosine methyltransferase n=1 Tax=Prauserella cavernicola TaxID=2800127 RepID=A0A934V222_9PSEU|nr:DNA cytosine methyltransferase [Prauserella cavernicola]MBK1784556.1 DNA cytosine methyltransferase [Prauserella cavernicola]
MDAHPLTAPDTRPRLLDLCCGAGGASLGYHQAGFAVTGVDIAPQPNYPFTFHQADALEFLAAHGHEFDAIHISPPCQAYSPLNAYNHKTYPDFIGDARDLLIRTNVPWVIENVVQAPLHQPIVLCGAMFGLQLYRHRGFETSRPITAPAHPEHLHRCARNGYLPQPGQFMTITGGRHSRAWQAKAAQVMGTPWTRTIREVCEAIPPAYTRYIGTTLATHLTTTTAPAAA